MLTFFMRLQKVEQRFGHRDFAFFFVLGLELILRFCCDPESMISEINIPPCQKAQFFVSKTAHQEGHVNQPLLPLARIEESRKFLRFIGASNWVHVLWPIALLEEIDYPVSFQQLGNDYSTIVRCARRIAHGIKMTDQ